MEIVSQEAILPGLQSLSVDELLADAGKAKAWEKKFEYHSILVVYAHLHCNPCIRPMGGAKVQRRA